MRVRVRVRAEFLKCFTMPLKRHFHPISLYGPLFGPHIRTFTRLFICHLLRFVFSSGAGDDNTPFKGEKRTTGKKRWADVRFINVSSILSPISGRNLYPSEILKTSKDNKL